MKLHIVLPDDQTMHIYCVGCQRESVTVADNGMYCCTACGHTNPRAIIIDPQIKWQVDSTGEYQHETAGVIVVDEQGRILLFNRTRFPSGLTVPAGHVDKGESPVAAAVRELREETGLVVDESVLTPIGCDALYGDSCRRGSDMHVWHSFAVRRPTNQPIAVDPAEGEDAVWMTRADALRSNLTFATRQVLTRHQHEFERGRLS